MSTEWAIGNEGDAFVRGEVDHIVLISLEDVVAVLDRRDGRHRLRGAKLFNGNVRHTDMRDFPCVSRLGECRDGDLNRRVGIDPVKLKQPDLFDTQVLQRVIDLLGQHLRAAVLDHLSG